MLGLKAKNERGFTLIEMSIVLIIIGLIIGGILKGQELIESARQKNVISQIDAIRAAVNTFQDRFENFPGDALGSVICATCPTGDRNGIIGTQRTNIAGIIGDANTIDAAQENAGFFSQMAGGNVLGGVAVVTSGTLTNFAGAGGSPSPLPNSALPQSGLTLSYGTHEAGAAGSSILANWLRLSRFNGALTVANDKVISPARAYQLDSKYDDGSPSGGRIRTSQSANGTAATSDCGDTTATSAYAQAENRTGCILLIALE